MATYERTTSGFEGRIRPCFAWIVVAVLTYPATSLSQTGGSVVSPSLSMIDERIEQAFSHPALPPVSDAQAFDRREAAPTLGRHGWRGLYRAVYRAGTPRTTIRTTPPASPRDDLWEPSTEMDDPENKIDQSTTAAIDLIETALPPPDEIPVPASRPATRTTPSTAGERLEPARETRRASVRPNADGIAIRTTPRGAQARDGAARGDVTEDVPRRTSPTLPASLLPTRPPA